MSLFIIMGLKGYIVNEQLFDWIGISAMILFVLVFIVYKLITYKKNLKHLLALDMKDKELLKYRLQFIEKEWNF